MSENNKHSNQKLYEQWRTILENLDEQSFDKNNEDINRRFLLEKAIDSYNRELSLIWSRSQFFWLITGAVLTAFGVFQGQNRPLVALALSCFGFIASLSWTLLNRGSKYWYESWEIKIHSDKDLSDWFCKTAEYRKGSFWLHARRFSPSKLAIGVSDFVMLFWLGIIIFQILDQFLNGNSNWNDLKNFSPVLLIVFTLSYGLFILCASASEGVLRSW